MQKSWTQRSKDLSVKGDVPAAAVGSSRSPQTPGHRDARTTPVRPAPCPVLTRLPGSPDSGCVSLSWGREATLQGPHPGVCATRAPADLWAKQTPDLTPWPLSSERQRPLTGPGPAMRPQGAVRAGHRQKARCLPVAPILGEDSAAGLWSLWASNGSKPASVDSPRDGLGRAHTHLEGFYVTSHRHMVG